MVAAAKMAIPKYTCGSLSMGSAKQNPDADALFLLVLAERFGSRSSPVCEESKIASFQKGQRVRRYTPLQPIDDQLHPNLSDDCSARASLSLPTGSIAGKTGEVNPQSPTCVFSFARPGRRWLRPTGLNQGG